jgi:ACS family sodium-dependent inorganic phosphate cotransporter-like MFS transporter 5
MSWTFILPRVVFLSSNLYISKLKSGIFAALPYLFAWITVIVASIVADKLITSKVLSKTMTRRVFNSLGILIPVGALIGLTFIPVSNAKISLVVLSIGFAASGLHGGGGNIPNINEVGGKYAGVLYSIANTVGTIPGIVAPYVVGVMTPHVSLCE